MTSVDAQWALQGKTLGRDGYRVLACSTGSLSLQNFTDAIGRVSMGTPETLANALPQVTISHLRLGEVSHLAFAIHQFASEAYPDGQLAATDDDGRPVVATSYYCVPYKPVAERSVSYRGMYEAFSAVPLRPENGDELTVELPVTSAASGSDTIDLLAAKAAALLLLGRPVCVLGATLQTSMTDRLGFIDTVMSLLPYGFRARMTAATWTRATNQKHRFRLFFSGARRDVRDPDNVVFWGRPEQTVITRNDDIADWYLEWLGNGQVTQKQLSRLADLRDPRSLASSRDVLASLDDLDDIVSASGRHHRSPKFTPRPATPDPQERTRGKGLGQVKESTAPAPSEVEQILIDCAQYMEETDTRQLSSAISRLKMPARRGIGPGERDRCRELIRKHQLFRHDEALGKDEEALREILLKIAFQPPLSYQDYCLIEDGAGGVEDEEGKTKNLDPSLLQLIDKQEVADDRVKAITYKQLPHGDSEKKLSKWYGSKELNAYALLDLLALEVKSPWHMRLLCDVTTDYLRKMSKTYDAKGIDWALRRHSYLALRLQNSLPGENQRQLDTLGTFLRVAYPNGITRAELYHVLIGTDEPVTFSFLGAVLLMVKDREDTFLARELFVHSSFMAMGLETNTTRELEKLILPMLEAQRPQTVARAPERKAQVLGPLSPHDDPQGALTRQLPAGDAAALTSDQSDEGGFPPSEGSVHSTESWPAPSDMPGISNDGQ